MEKFYIVTNEKFLKEIDDYRKHEEERRIVANNFFEIIRLYIEKKLWRYDEAIRSKKIQRKHIEKYIEEKIGKLDIQIVVKN